VLVNTSRSWREITLHRYEAQLQGLAPKVASQKRISIVAGWLGQEETRISGHAPCPTFRLDERNHFNVFLLRGQG
jgi:hypothetical protein